MCLVEFHPNFDASIHETEMTVPNAREYLVGLKWNLEHGEEQGVYLPELDVYRLTYDRIQVFYGIRDDVGQPRRITILLAQPRPDP